VNGGFFYAHLLLFAGTLSDQEKTMTRESIRLIRPVLCAGALLMSSILITELPAGQAAPAALRTPFNSNVKVTLDKDDMIVESDGIPNHPHGDFPNASNPNAILKQHYRFVIPRHPKLAAKITPTPFGPIGVAINGIPFYNQYNGEGEDAVKLETFDSCCPRAATTTTSTRFACIRRSRTRRASTPHSSATPLTGFLSTVRTGRPASRRKIWIRVMDTKTRYGATITM